MKRALPQPEAEPILVLKSRIHARMATEKKAPAKKAAGAKKATAKKAPAKKQPTKDPKGGLTAAADSPEKMVRKGSFLRRHFANPQGPMERDDEPTRLALSAHAWGEPVPHSEADAEKLAEKGSELLEQYHEAKGDGKA